ncbi:MAG TPA: TatD family hydrolase [Vicinamibacterales bacterium]|nr:TatD family hydrolase [Vicinamibacterales bacterium]
MLIDTHCHLADEKFVDDLDAVVARAKAAGVERALCILSADEPEEIARFETVRGAWPEVRAAAAIHPHRAGAYEADPQEAARLARAAVERSDAVAIGEIGLDYHYDFSPRPVQAKVFASQIELALELDRPVIIHTREAADDTIAMLKDAGQGRVRGVMHCFTGTQDEARRALEIGFFVSLAGILTFPRAENLRELARFLPDDRILIETDAPFLAPIPHRGKRNEPAWVVETFAALAAARQVAREALAARLADNFAAFLGDARNSHVR